MAVGLGLGHSGRPLVDGIPPEPLVAAGPDAARRAFQNVAVINLVVRQRQRVAAVRRGPDRLAQRQTFRATQGERTNTTPTTISEARRNRVARPPVGRSERRARPGPPPAGRSVDRAPRGPADRRRTRAPIGLLGRRRPARRSSRKAASVSVITNRACQTRTGSQATIRPAAVPRIAPRPSRWAARNVRPAVAAPSSK